MSYSDKLKDPRWQKMRLEILERDGFACRKCQAKNKTLHVHHSYYMKGKNPWEYSGNSLITLCEDCHKHVEEIAFCIRFAMRNMFFSKYCSMQMAAEAVSTLCRYIENLELTEITHDSAASLLESCGQEATWRKGYTSSSEDWLKRIKKLGLTREAYDKAGIFDDSLS